MGVMAAGAGLRPALGLLAGLAVLAAAGPAPAGPEQWRQEWPATDFSRASVDLGEIVSGGPPRDGIPPIDHPVFAPVAETNDIDPKEPVIALVVDGVARAYPLRLLTWHEIANDVIAGMPVAVTYCPLCNAAIVFDRRVGGRVLSFGTTGKLRFSDLIMYDRQTESWWQQFTGEAIVGRMTGAVLKTVPARLDSFQRFAERHPDGMVQRPNDPAARPYGANPYIGYDSSPAPFLYAGPLPDGIAPLARVVVVGDNAWALDLLRRERRIETAGLTLRWIPGQASALDTRRIAEGREVGNVVVQRDGSDIAHEVTFAFVFHAFRPDGRLVTE